MLRATTALALVAEEPLVIPEMAARVAPRNIMPLREPVAQGAAAAALGLLDNTIRLQ